MVGRKEGWIPLWRQQLSVVVPLFPDSTSTRRSPLQPPYSNLSLLLAPIASALHHNFLLVGIRSQQSLFLLCDSCQAIQPLHHSIDYFGLFFKEKSYDVKENLDRKYKDWQNDLVHTKSQREFAAEKSARITDAHRTLSNIYMLKLEGVDVNEEETISEPQLLAEIMEIREAVEEASGSKALTDIQTLMREKLQQWANNFGKGLESQNLEEARKCTQRMTYYDRVHEEIVKRL